LSDLDAMRDQQLPNQMSHKEETAGRMKTDQKDREILCSKLQLAIDPLDPLQHSEGLMNIIKWQWAHRSPNKCEQWYVHWN